MHMIIDKLDVTRQQEREGLEIIYIDNNAYSTRLKNK